MAVGDQQDDDLRQGSWTKCSTVVVCFTALEVLYDQKRKIYLDFTLFKLIYRLYWITKKPDNALGNSVNSTTSLTKYILAQRWVSLHAYDMRLLFSNFKDT